MKNAIAFLAVLSTVLVGCTDEESGEQATAVSDLPFRAGQVWKYQTRPGEEASRVVVCRVEPDAKLGTIIHISVEGVAIKTPASPDGLSRHIGHMPFARKALRQSVVALESTRESLPDYEEGYRIWKEGFDNGKAGIFTISVAEGIDFMEQALNR